MCDHIFALISIMFISGIFGGVVNFLLEQRDHPEKSSILRSTVAGVAASFLVPLFLNMISSELINKSATEIDKLLIFAGFCLIASISSSAFIRTLSDKILKEAEEANRIAKELKKDVEPVLAKETERDPDDEQPPSRSNFAASNSNEDKVLRALAASEFSMRSISGICNDTQLDRKTVQEALSVLSLAGFASRNERKKGIRWSITSEGRSLLKE